MSIWRKQQNTANLLEGYTFMATAILVLSVFLVLPIIWAVILAFNKVQLLGEVSYRFVGIKNYARMLQDERVRIALKNTAEYVAIVVPIQTVLALALALVLNAQIKGKQLFRTIFFLPTV